MEKVGFIKASDYVNRKRNASTEPVVVEHKRLRIQNNNNTSTISESSKTSNERLNRLNKQNASKRCLSGDVQQILHFNKKYPELDAFYEVFAKVYKIDASKERQKFLLLRNESGPVIQSVFDEIDVRMIEVKPGDAVRCVGKFSNNSRLKLFKIGIVDNSSRLVSRLYSVSNFALHNE